MFKFFDKLEDRVRRWFSRRAILYGFVGGVGIVLFWRGVWHTADYLSARFIFSSEIGEAGGALSTVDFGNPWDGLLSLIAGSAILLITGIFVSSFIGNEIIISGLRGEKKLVDKTESEIEAETNAILKIKDEIKEISASLDELNKKK